MGPTAAPTGRKCCSSLVVFDEPLALVPDRVKSSGCQQSCLSPTASIHLAEMTCTLDVVGATSKHGTYRRSQSFRQANAHSVKWRCEVAWLSPCRRTCVPQARPVEMRHEPKPFRVGGCANKLCGRGDPAIERVLERKQARNRLVIPSVIEAGV